MRCAFLLILLIAFYSVRAQKKIVAIGDSHGAAAHGWVSQLRELRPNDSIYSFCVSGNTIGFDNNGKPELNELRMLNEHLETTLRVFGRVDYFIVLLGTNDCKAAFAVQQREVPENLRRLLTGLQGYGSGLVIPAIVLVTPLPISDDDKLDPKYHGGAARLSALSPSYHSLASEFGVPLVDLYALLNADYESLNTDGIHLTEEGYGRIAGAINKAIR